MADFTATATDRLGGVDSLAPVYAGAVAQPVAELTDTLAVTHGSSIAGGTLGITDSVDVDYTLGIIVRTVDDGLGISDAGTDRTVADDLADTLGTTDTPARTSTYVRTQADDLGLTDSAGEGVDHVRTASSTLGALDVAAVVQEHAATVTDDLGATDSNEVDKQGIGQEAADDLGLTDDTVASIGRNATADDDAGLTDAHTVALGRGVADALGLTDATSITHDHVVILYDNLAGQGSIDTEAAGAATRSSVDRLSLSDDVTVTHVKVMDVDLADSLSVTDVALPAIGYALTVADDLGGTDVATDGQSTAHARTVTDPLGLDDNIGLGFTPARNITRSVSDQVGPSDALTFDAAYTLTAEALGATDSVNVSVYSLEENITDAIGATDSATATLFHVLLSGDRVTIVPAESRRIVIRPEPRTEATT